MSLPLKRDAVAMVLGMGGGQSEMDPVPLKGGNGMFVLRSLRRPQLQGRQLEGGEEVRKRGGKVRRRHRS